MTARTANFLFCAVTVFSTSSPTSKLLSTVVGKLADGDPTQVSTFGRPSVERVGDLLDGGLDARAAARGLVKEAVARGSTDNVTAVVVIFAR